MAKERTTLEKTLPQVRALYAAENGDLFGKIQQSVAVSMIKGMIAIEKASKRAQKHIREHTKSNGR